MIETNCSVWRSEESNNVSLLAASWIAAIAGDRSSQLEWQVVDGGRWLWQRDGVVAQSNGSEWLSLQTKGAGNATLRSMENFLLEVTVAGNAEAAGLSFGPYRDFLTRLDPRMGPQRVQVEVDLKRDIWTFRVDGRDQARSWWDSGIRDVSDIIDGTLQLKARRAESVLFCDLAVHQFAAPCKLSVIITCHRFRQRLSVSLRNWCHQSLPSGAYEILVVNPDSPDGTHEYLGAVARSYPTVRLRELFVDRELATNKGAMINRAFSASHGDFIWLTDADCLVSPDCAALVQEYIKGKDQHLFYGQRRQLTARQTDNLLSGHLDGLVDFETLARDDAGLPTINAPWGYTQIVHRSVLDRVPYREHLNHYAGTDNSFVLDCQEKGFLVEQVPELFCLHMEHPFAWYGTTMFL